MSAVGSWETQVSSHNDHVGGWRTSRRVFELSPNLRIVGNPQESQKVDRGVHEKASLTLFPQSKVRVENAGIPEDIVERVVERDLELVHQDRVILEVLSDVREVYHRGDADAC